MGRRGAERRGGGDREGGGGGGGERGGRECESAGKSESQGRAIALAMVSVKAWFSPRTGVYT